MRRGFTLIEIMVVVVIIALMTTMAVTGYLVYLKNARIRLTRANISTAVENVDGFKMQKSHYPESFDEIVRTGLLKFVPLDGWEHTLIYQKGGTAGGPYRVGSYGGDGQPGGTDEDADLWSDDKTPAR